MSKELILLEDVANLGKIGDKVRVSDGYARNFLLPRKLAQAASTGLLRQIEAKKLLLQKEHEERIEVARSMAAKIAGITLEIPVAVAENDKLYGSVNSQMLTDALQAHGIEIDKSTLLITDGIRALGETAVEIKLHTDVKAVLKVNVVRKTD
jgi:large subunit ribosomal protein L9